MSKSQACDHGYDEDEEPLSLSDLPIQLLNNPPHTSQPYDEPTQDFYFDPTATYMCSPDQVFHQGKIRPTQSISLDLGSNPTSRSSSSSSLPAKMPPPVTARNPFQAQESPSPQLRFRPARAINSGARRSTGWDILRVGVVRIPRMDLERLKQVGHKNDYHKCRSRGSFGSQNSSSSNGSNIDGVNLVKRGMGVLLGKKGPFWGVCKCSVDEVDDPSSNVNNNYTKEEKSDRRQSRHWVWRHDRTFEWLKELSHAPGSDDVVP